MSATEFRRSRSTRVPDFVQLRLYLDPNFHCIRSRADVIVELKRRGLNARMTGKLLTKAYRQVEEQAKHAFLQDDDLVAVGFIIAAGNVWRYGKFDRTDSLAKQDVNATRDGTYTPTPAPSGTSEDSDSPSASTSLQRSSLSTTPIHSARPEDTSDSASPQPRTIITKIGISPDLRRSANPSPPSQAEVRLSTIPWPRVFTDISLPEQRQWLSDVKDRLDEMDGWMAETYHT